MEDEQPTIAPEQEAPAPMPAWDGSPRLVAPKDWPALHGGLSYREWLAQQEREYEDRADRQDFRYTRYDDDDDGDWGF